MIPLKYSVFGMGGEQRLEMFSVGAERLNLSVLKAHRCCGYTEVQKPKGKVIK